MASFVDKINRDVHIGIAIIVVMCILGVFLAWSIFEVRAWIG